MFNALITFAIIAILFVIIRFVLKKFPAIASVSWSAFAVFFFVYFVNLQIATTAFEIYSLDSAKLYVLVILSILYIISFCISVWLYESSFTIPFIVLSLSCCLIFYIDSKDTLLAFCLVSISTFIVGFFRAKNYKSKLQKAEQIELPTETNTKELEEKSNEILENKHLIDELRTENKKLQEEYARTQGIFDKTYRQLSLLLNENELSYNGIKNRLDNIREGIDNINSTTSEAIHNNTESFNLLSQNGKNEIQELIQNNINEIRARNNGVEQVFIRLFEMNLTKNKKDDSNNYDNINILLDAISKNTNQAG